MTVNLTPELERLLDEHLASGEYESREALVAQALIALLSTKCKAQARLSGEERAKQLEAFFEEIDRDPPSDAGPLSD
ncbi:MAG: hypothetical protein H6509_06620 [Bryobacterales bacterium]|nr:hypothetical protein [Bryobacterales bacterium]